MRNQDIVIQQSMKIDKINKNFLFIGLSPDVMDMI